MIRLIKYETGDITEVWAALNTILMCFNAHNIEVFKRDGVFNIIY